LKHKSCYQLASCESSIFKGQKTNEQRTCLKWQYSRLDSYIFDSFDETVHEIFTECLFITCNAKSEHWRIELKTGSIRNKYVCLLWVMSRKEWWNRSIGKQCIWFECLLLRMNEVEHRWSQPMLINQTIDVYNKKEKPWTYCSVVNHHDMEFIHR
jgi:hypothetical protein